MRKVFVKLNKIYSFNEICEIKRKSDEMILVYQFDFIFISPNSNI